MAVNGVYIVQGELNSLVAQLRRSTTGNQKWQSSLSAEQDVLLRSFVDLREVLNTVPDLSDMAPSTFLAPFLEVIRSEHTNGQVTGQALAAVGKFISYGLINPHNFTAPGAVQSIADSVNHTRFVGNDAGSDEVVLFRILQVLRALLLTPVGSLLSDESVCELLQSCFRICFEKRLTELLRKSAECCLMDMVQLLFTRLPTFVEDPRHPYVRRLKMRAEKRSKVYKGEAARGESQSEPDPMEGQAEMQTGTDEPVRENQRPNAKTAISLDEKSSDCDVISKDQDDQTTTKSDPVDVDQPTVDDTDQIQTVLIHSPQDQVAKYHEIITETGLELPSPINSDTEEEYDRSRDVRVTVEKPSPDYGGGSSNSTVTGGPYGLPSVRELLRFLISVSNPDEKQNSDEMLELGLNLLIVALEAGADYLGKFSILLPLIRNELCKILNLNLLSSKSSIFASTLRVGFLCFEALRTHLKFQLESYLMRLKELVLSDQVLSPGAAVGGSGSFVMQARHSGPSVQSSTLFERKELALEALVELWRIPGLVTELYLNYDCDLYCSNLFEELTKLLSKNSFPIGQELTSAHLLSLDALLTVVDSIEINCHYRMLNYNSESKEKASREVDPKTDDESDQNVTSANYMLPLASGISAGRLLASRNVHPTTEVSPNFSADDKGNEALLETMHLPQLRPNRMPIRYEEIFSHEDLIARKQKKRLLQTGTDLFNQSPAKGVAFLQEHGLFRTPMHAEDVVEWLKENPHLDKRKIAEYIVNRKQSQILEAFVKSFEFRGLRIDQALRQFLETFRLPGEAAEIFMVVEHFSDHWHSSNGRPFASTDAAFTLAYAVIILNVDHHNPMAKKQNQPMSAEAFKKNLNGVNGGQNFDQSMLDEVYKAVSGNEIIMPAEQAGSVRENYLWKLLLKRGAKPEGRFVHAPSGLYDHDLFHLVWGPTVAALSYVFDKTQDEQISARAAGGFRKCSAVAAHYVMSDVFDNLVINLCKFSQILAFPENPTQLVAHLAENHKSQCAAKTMFQLVRNHGDILREGWKNVCECMVQLFKADLLPESLTKVEDFVHPDGQISIAHGNFCSKKSRDVNASAASIFSSFYNYLGGSTGADDSPGGALSSSTSSTDGATIARDLVAAECKPDQLIAESKYLTSEALADLLKALVVGGAQATNAWTSALPSMASGRQKAESREKDDDAELSAVFYLELLVSVCLENRDRLTPYWRTLRAHIFSLVAAGEQRRRWYGDAGATTTTTADDDDDDDGAKSSKVGGGDAHRRLALERSLVALFRLVARLLARASRSGDEFSLASPKSPGDDFSTTLVGDLVDSLTSLRRSLRRSTIIALSRQIAGGAAHVVRAGGQALRAAPRAAWAPIVDLLEAAGAGVFEDEEIEGNDETLRAAKRRDDEAKKKALSRKPAVAKSDNESSRHASDVDDGDASLDRGYTSDTELYATSSVGGAGVVVASNQIARRGDSSLASSGEWLYVVGGGRGGYVTKTSRDVTTTTHRRPRVHDAAAFAQCCDTLAFWIRDAADLVTSQNFDLCVRCLRTFVYASVDAGVQRYSTPSTAASGKKSSRDKNAIAAAERQKSSAAALESLEEAALQLIDLAYGLHAKSSQIFYVVADDVQGVQTVWRECWLPVLQILAHACSDSRRRVRLSALTHLQRTLLMQELRLLSAIHWQECCYHVLFPLLAALLNEKEPHFYSGRKSPKSRLDPTTDPTAHTHQPNTGLDEARVRATTLTSKVFLQHLGPLSAHPRRQDFVQLWLDLLDFMARYLSLDNSDLNESVPESVKNMLLVLRTANLFKQDGILYEHTREKLSHFLPDLATMVGAEGGVVERDDVAITEGGARHKNDDVIVEGKRGEHHDVIGDRKRFDDNDIITDPKFRDEKDRYSNKDIVDNTKHLRADDVTCGQTSGNDVVGLREGDGAAVEHRGDFVVGKEVVCEFGVENLSPTMSQIMPPNFERKNDISSIALEEVIVDRPVSPLHIYRSTNKPLQHPCKVEPAARVSLLHSAPRSTVVLHPPIQSGDRCETNTEPSHVSAGSLGLPEYFPQETTKTNDKYSRIEP